MKKDAEMWVTDILLGLGEDPHDRMNRLMVTPMVKMIYDVGYHTGRYEQAEQDGTEYIIT
jgi:hypothetical protein